MINILVPWIRNIPDVPTDRITYGAPGEWQGLPLMPFIPSLLLRLQDWTDHLHAKTLDLCDKRHTDARDMTKLLEIAVCQVYSLDEDRTWLLASLIEGAEHRIPEYLTIHPFTSYNGRRSGLGGQPSWSRC
ncbi:hypothetical protein BDN71DRAFT_313877 [Pleurotus eryngii]|uniref:Uncharacterized protein n=1 Tax=Pleurotus eryngii TaxID=5323 RepID=A0A9P6DIG7_PLEER|nr:hypothetical protein BDN71DRAFT_313877 [Pleurotus eryngii]